MANDRQIGHLAHYVAPQPAVCPTLVTDRVDRNRGTEQVRELACNSGVGDRDTEFDGAADGVGKQAGGSVQSGSWAVLDAGVGTAILAPPRTPTSCASPHHRRTPPTHSGTGRAG